MVLYRKYRPQTLSELDLIQVRQRLEKTLASSYMPHAFLFAGPKGTGKTSAARIIAKIINCQKNIKSKPCNQCEACRSITEGRYMDVLEIDAASNRGIEDIRDLREKIKLAPVSATYKVYIIDEVHMLTNEAFNALLKTLEEPPKHAIFILATTQVDKLPDTIRSRCIRFAFHKATTEEILHSLNRVVEGEKLKVDKEVLNLIAGHADGSFRDATKILEQAISEKALTKEKITKILGRDSITPEKFLQFLSLRKTKDILSVVEIMGREGADIRFFVSNILYTLHDLLLKKYGLEQKNISEKLLDTFSKNQITEMIKLFSRVYVELRSASSAELPLEVAVVEWCERDVEN